MKIHDDNAGQKGQFVFYIGKVEKKKPCLWQAMKFSYLSQGHEFFLGTLAAKMCQKIRRQIQGIMRINNANISVNPFINNLKISFF